MYVSIVILMLVVRRNHDREKMKLNEWVFRPPLCTYRLNWAMRTRKLGCQSGVPTRNLRLSKQAALKELLMLTIFQHLFCFFIFLWSSVSRRSLLHFFQIFHIFKNFFLYFLSEFIKNQFVHVKDGWMLAQHWVQVDAVGPALCRRLMLCGQKKLLFFMLLFFIQDQ